MNSSNKWILIPVILLDRSADVAEDLYSTYIGSDFVWEGERACKLMAEYMGEEGNVVELQGTVELTLLGVFAGEGGFVFMVRAESGPLAG